MATVTNSSPSTEAQWASDASRIGAAPARAQTAAQSERTERTDEDGNPPPDDPAAVGAFPSPPLPGGPISTPVPGGSPRDGIALADERPSRFTVSIFGSEGALVGGPGDLTAHTTATLAAGLRVDTGITSRIYAGLQARAESPRTHMRPPGSVQADLAAADVVVRYAFHAPGQHGLEVTGGIGLQRIAASSTGYSSNREVQLFDPELVGYAQWRQEVWGGFFFTLFAGGEFRIRTETLEIAPFGTVMTLPAWGGRAGVGVGWAIP